MPRSRRRGGTRTPRSGDETTLPAMLISPDVGCSKPATQRKVVVLPQPEGPSRTTISPAGTWKLTRSTAGRPVAQLFARSRTSSAADTVLSPLLAIVVGLVPVVEPGGTQLLVLLEVREPGLHHLRIV